MGSMRELALLADVSVGTIWNYFNHPHLVGDENCSNIEKAVKATGFKYKRKFMFPNTQNYNTIGVIVPDFTNLFYIEVFRSLQNSLDEFGFSLALFDSKWSTQKEANHIEYLGKQKLAGMVLAPCGEIPKELKKISDRGIPCCIMGVRADSLDYFSVSTNDFDGGAKGLNFLADNGHTSIAWLTKADPVPPQLIERELGAFFSASERNVVLTKITTDEMSSAAGYQATKAILDLPFPVTAIFCSNDLLGLGVLQWLSESELEAKVSVVGYDNLEILDTTLSKLNSIAQKPSNIGSHIANIFLALANGGSRIDSINHNIVLETEVISRMTS